MGRKATHGLCLMGQNTSHGTPQGDFIRRYATHGLYPIGQELMGRFMVHEAPTGKLMGRDANHGLVAWFALHPMSFPSERPMGLDPFHGTPPEITHGV